MNLNKDDHGHPRAAGRSTAECLKGEDKATVIGISSVVRTQQPQTVIVSPYSRAHSLPGHTSYYTGSPRVFIPCSDTISGRNWTNSVLRPSFEAFQLAPNALVLSGSII